MEALEEVEGTQVPAQTQTISIGGYLSSICSCRINV